MASEAALVDCIHVLEEVIRSRQDPANPHEPTPSDFFGIIASILATGATEEKTGLMIRILSAVIPKASSNLVRTYFKPVFQALGKIMQSTEDLQLSSLCLSCIGSLLKQQETSEGFWNGLPALQATNTLLTFIDGQPRLRKIAWEALTTLTELHAKQGATAYRTYLAEFILGVFKDTNRSNYRRGHCVVVFLESALVYLPEQSAKKVIENALKLQACEIPRLTAAVYRMIDTYLQSPVVSFSANVARSVLKVLLNNPPNTQDVETLCHFQGSLTSALVLLDRASGAHGFLGSQEGEVELVRRTLQQLQRSLDSDFAAVHVAVAASYKRIAFCLVTDRHKAQLQSYLSSLNIEVSNILEVTGHSVPGHVQIMRDIIAFAVQSLQLQYRAAWMYVLDCIRSLLVLWRGHASVNCIVVPILVSLGDVYSALDSRVFNLPDQVRGALVETLGAAIQTAGLKKFLQVLPIVDASSTETGELVTRDWVISTLHAHLSQCSLRLADFVVVLLPLAQTFHQISQRYKPTPTAGEGEAANVPRDGENGRKYRFFRDKVLQIWSLFPELCGATLMDVAVSVPKIIPILETACKDPNYPELAFLVTLGVSKWITNENIVAAHGTTLNAVASSVVPLLLQTIETINMGDAKFQETLDCFKNWLPRAPAALVSSVTKRMLQMVLSHTSHSCAETDPAEQHAAAVWMAVLLATVTQASAPIILVMYKTVRPLLALSADVHALQKRAYQLLHALLANRADVLFSQGEESPTSLLQLLITSLPTAHASSRNVRMRCLATLLEQIDDLDLLTQAFQSLGPELLVSLKDANRKTRLQAIEILKVLTVKLPWESLYGGFGQVVFTGADVSSSAAYGSYQHDSETVMTGMTGGKRSATLWKAAAVTAFSILLVEYSAQKQALLLEDGDDDEDDNESDDENGEVFASQKEARWSHYTSSLQQLTQALLAPAAFSSLRYMLQQETSDQSKAVLSLLKLLTIFGDRETLQEALPQILAAICVDTGALKAKFSSRVRAIFRKLLRKFDIETLRVYVPSGDQALLDYLARQQRKRIRRLARGKTVDHHHSAQQEQQQAKKDKLHAAQGYYDRLMASDSEDDDEDEDENDDEEGGTMRGSIDRRSVSPSNSLSVVSCLFVCFVL